MKTNYHTHNYRCNHATGTASDYVEEAIKNGFSEIGISDHLPHPGKDIDNHHRMAVDDIPNYIKEIEEAIEKHKEKISIKKGLECEYFEDLLWFYKDLREKYKFDYLILGAHFFPYKGEWHYVGHGLTKDMLDVYSDYVVKSIKSGLFNYIAHPDLFGLGYKDFDENAIKASRKILKAAEELNIPMEINVNGMRKPKVKYNGGERYAYPIKEFWELSKEYNVKRIIGIDAHNPCELGDFEMGVKFAKEHVLEIIEKLEL